MDYTVVFPVRRWCQFRPHFESWRKVSPTSVQWCTNRTYVPCISLCWRPHTSPRLLSHEGVVISLLNSNIRQSYLPRIVADFGRYNLLTISGLRWTCVGGFQVELEAPFNNLQILTSFSFFLLNLLSLNYSQSHKTHADDDLSYILFTWHNRDKPWPPLLLDLFWESEYGLRL